MMAERQTAPSMWELIEQAGTYMYGRRCDNCGKAELFQIDKGLPSAFTACRRCDTSFEDQQRYGGEDGA